MNVIIIAKAIIALKEILDRIFEAIERRANESERLEIARASTAYETAKTNKEKLKEARKIQAGFGGSNNDFATELPDESKERT